MKRLIIGGAAAAAVLCAVSVAVATWRGRESRPWKVMSYLTVPLAPAFADVGPPVELPMSITPRASLPGWHWFQSDLVRVLDHEAGLVVESAAETVWYQNARGPMLWTPVEGDIDVRMIVRTRKASAPQEFPDEAWQFGGVILRDPRGNRPFGLEDYVFNVVGHRGSRLQVETKSTRRGVSDVAGHDWPSGDAELRIVRQGDRFQLFVRAIGASEWQALAAYERPDLPELLQLGMIAYSYDYGGGRFDLRVGFERLEASAVRAP